jgi:8-oxo-dGTP pyrophosphatase MutT (NUDIX family)
MKQVAKLVVIDDANKYLLLQLNNHPIFLYDPDLPGGTAEAGELPLDAMLREVAEEAGFSVDKNVVRKVYEGAEYSAHHTHYSLYVAKLAKRPEVILSWEHLSYSWLDRDEFLGKTKEAKDTYMHMVHDVMLRDTI